MTWTGAPRETLKAVALRAFRSPVSGLATMLAAIAAELDASIVAAYLIPPSPDSVELLAAGGPKAATLGPPGRAQANLAASLRDLARDLNGSGQTSGALAEVPAWSDHRHAIATAVMLEGSTACLLNVGSQKEIDADSLFADSSTVGLLAQMIVLKRDVDALRQQLHDLKQDRSLLTAGLQHDLKGPLTSILGSAHTLLARDDELDDDTRMTLLGGIAAQSERLNRMLNETLAQQATDPNAPVRQLNTKLHEMATRIADTARARGGAPIVVEAAEICLVTDPDRLERALGNLVDNALKYSPPDVPVHLIVEEEGPNVVITVADNGPGVSSDVLPGLFTAYATDPSRSDGTGLGLHSVRTLVEELGGRVGYSRHSDWTRFSIYLSGERGEPC